MVFFLPWGQLLLLGVAAFLWPEGCYSGSSLHSLRFFYTLVSESSPGLPQFIAVGYVDDQLFARFDSDTRRAQPQVPWIEGIGKDHAHFWDLNTQRALNSEMRFRRDLVTLQKHYNQSGGFHTWQRMYGCKLSEDGRKGGYTQYGYDGKDYISFDKETLTWTAADAAAQVFKRKREANLAYSQHLKAYLEEECVQWLQMIFAYGEEALLRREPPVVKLAHKAGSDGPETLICRAYGFYPKEINATWSKNGKVWEQESFNGGVVPNSDGSYHTWISIQIDSKDRARYQCHVTHVGLSTPVDLSLEEDASSHVGLVVGVVLGVSVILLIGGIFLYLKKRRDGYKAASRIPAQM